MGRGHGQRIRVMYAKAVQGVPAEEAVAWAESELKKIYEPA